MRGLVLPVALATLLFVPALEAAPLEPEAALALSQSAVGRTVAPYVLIDDGGRPLSLERFRGRPLVISLIFTSCSSVCPVASQHLRDAVTEAQRALGRESFAVLTFGFNAQGDTPERLAAFARAQGLDAPNWYLASADPATTEALLADLGFSWQAAAGGLVHLAQTSILDGEGRVYRQVYGEDFPLPLFMEPLKELVLGVRTLSATPSDLWNRLRFLCTVYDPASGAYRFDYGIFFGIAIGGFSLALMGAIIFRLWRANRRAEAALQGQDARGRPADGTVQ